MTKPEDFPSFVSVLELYCKPTALLKAIKAYKHDLEYPDHELEPYEYLEAQDYIAIIDQFETLIQDELKSISNRD